MASEPKKLYRSRNSRMISGVCGGLAEYLNIDPVVVRLIFVITAIFRSQHRILGVYHHVDRSPGAASPIAV